MQTSGSEPRWLRIVGIATFLGAVLVGAWLRFDELGIKPLHSDEGVNGWFLMRLYNGLRDFGNWNMAYRYDPTNYHGPFLYFAGLIPFFLLGPSNETLRLFMAVAGVGCIAVLWAARRWLGWAGLAFAAWLIAISPPLVYFSRTAIHEIYVAFFSLSAVICFARCYEGTWRPGATAFRANWLLFGVISACLVFTNKETAVITFASFAGAAFVAWFFSKSDPSEDVAPAAGAKRRKKEKEKEKEGDPSSQPAPLAALVRFGGAALLAIAPFALLWMKVKEGRPFKVVPADERWYVVGSLVFGVAAAAAWLAGTRGERFLAGARLSRLAVLVRYMAGGALFMLAGPLFLARWLATRLPFLHGVRAPLESLAGRVERKLPAPFDDLSDYALAYAWGVAVVVILFTSFFNNLRGAWDMFATYGTWVNRGHEGAGHEKPFAYWIDLFWEFDAPILFAGMLGTVIALFRRDRFALFVASWAWSQWLVYSVISYKTPWLNLNFTLPLAVTAGLVMREIGRAFGRLPAARAALLVVVPALVLLWPVPSGPVLSPKKPNTPAPWAKVMWDINFVHYDDDRYDIIYVQTVREFEGLIEKMEQLFDRYGDKLTVWVTSGDYWPMPYYLREYDKTVAYYQGKVPQGAVPQVVVAASTQEHELRSRTAGYRRIPFMLRPGIALALLVDPEIADPVFGPPPGEAPPSPPPEDPSHRANGLVAEYRYGIGCTGEVLARRVDEAPRYGVKGEREFRAPLCASWRGFVKIDEAGDYAFGTSSDDGSWVYVDGKIAVDNGGTHGPQDREGALRALEPGLHAVEVRYFDAGGGATLRVWMRRRDGARVYLDGAASLLYHDARWMAQAP